MKSIDIYKAKADYNKWLYELTQVEKLLIIQMLDEAQEIGYENGVKANNTEATP